MADGSMGGAASSEVLALMNSINQGINQISETLGAVFPQGNAVALSAGGASGKYLVVQLPDGTTGKIALLAP